MLKRGKMDSSSWCISGIQTRFRYLTEISVCILWILSLSTYRLRRQHLAEVLLQGSLIIRSLDIVAMTLFQKDRRTPDMRAGTNRDLPGCTSPIKLVGINHPHITLKATGNKVQASNGTTETSTTTSSNTMKKFRVAIREDVCLSLPVATLISRWIILASTPGWPPLKKCNKTYATPCISIFNGRQKWEAPSPTSSKTSSNRTRTGTTCSRISTSTHRTKCLQQHPSLGEEDPPFIKGKFSFSSTLFLLFNF